MDSLRQQNAVAVLGGLQEFFEIASPSFFAVKFKNPGGLKCAKAKLFPLQKLPGSLINDGSSLQPARIDFTILRVIHRPLSRQVGESAC
jgi:hypothetical protein